MPTMPKADRPKMLIDRSPSAREQQASAIYASRTKSIAAWMDLPSAPTMADYARDLCQKFGITNPEHDLITRIVRLANKDY